MVINFHQKIENLFHEGELVEKNVAEEENSRRHQILFYVTFEEVFFLGGGGGGVHIRKIKICARFPLIKYSFRYV